MPSAKDVTIDTANFKCFVVGDSGTGKSIFASTFPKPAFLFNFDRSILSYRGLDVNYEDYTPDPASWVKFEKDFKALKKLYREDKANFPYKTIIIDSTTSWTDIAMERALQLDPKRSATGGPVWNVHYGMVKNLIEGYVRQLLEFDCNIVVIGHLQRQTDAESGAVLSVEPMLTGALSTKVPSYFDEVYYATSKTVQGKTSYYLLTIAKGLLKARSRISGVQAILPAELPNDYNEIIKLIQNKK